MLDGRRVLVVHSDVLIGLVIADRLEEEGAHIVGPAHNLEHALKCVEEPNVAAAVLNFVFHGGDTLLIAERLHARCVPIVFFTGMPQDFMAPICDRLDARLVVNSGNAEPIAAAVGQMIGLLSAAR
jgi:CheY-like chemotaxis protein